VLLLVVVLMSMILELELELVVSNFELNLHGCGGTIVILIANAASSYY